jgi:thiol reductant ABC exporter CydC subunit
MTFTAPFKTRVLLSIALQFLTVSSNIGLMVTSAYLIAAAALHPSTILLLWVPIVSVRFFGIGRAVFRYAEQCVSHDLALRILANIRVWLFARVESLPSDILQRRRSGNILSSLVRDVDTLQNLYLRALIPPVVACLVAVLTYFVMKPFGSDLAFVLLGAYLFAGFGVPLIMHRFSRRTGEQVVDAQADLTAQLAEHLQGQYETQLYPGGRLLAKLTEKHARLARLQFRAACVNSVSSVAAVLLPNLAMWILLWMAIPRVADHSVRGVFLPVIALAALASFEAVKPLSAAFQHWGQVFGAAGRLFALTDAGVQAPAKSTCAPHPPKDFSLSVRNLTFQYPGETSPALCDVDFDLPHGKHIAIVGENGAGKSTLANVLLGFYQYHSGSIRLGDAELSELGAESVRQAIALVSQHTYLFNASVLENLRMANPTATMSELENAARAAQIHDVVVNLPQGYDTLIGEAGARLSGGERQRLALARAIVRGAPILVFDEPTNGLDSITERRFFEALRPVIAERSAIFITHRLVGLEEMDEILVMQQGRIVERGTHYALLERNGLYKAMWELQRQMVNSSPA